MQNNGVEGEIYPDFKPCIPEELRKHIGVYILYGLSLTPEINMKFQSQADDNKNGNERSPTFRCIIGLQKNRNIVVLHILSILGYSRAYLDRKSVV